MPNDRPNQKTPDQKKTAFPYVLDRCQLAEARRAWRGKKNTAKVTMAIGSVVVRMADTDFRFNADVLVNWDNEHDQEPSISIGFPRDRSGFKPLFYTEGKTAKQSEQAYNDFQTTCEQAFVDMITPLILDEKIPPVDDVQAAIALIGTSKRGTSLKAATAAAAAKPALPRLVKPTEAPAAN